MKGQVNNPVTGGVQPAKIIIHRIRGKEEGPVMAGRGICCEIRCVEEAPRDITYIPHIKIILYIELVVIVKAIADGVKICDHG